MMGITDNYFRSFIRLLTKNACLYTEMIHTDTVINSKYGYKNELEFEYDQHPIVVQLGGNIPEVLGDVAKLCKEMGYDEINLNCGCPSSKVSSNNFGAVLMENPTLVSECARSIRNSSNLETSIKCRLGLNTFRQEFFDDFISIVNKQGNVKHFIIHSRLAIMNLDTDKNRKIPPLQYEKIFSLKKKFVDLNFSINGGFKNLDEVQKILQNKEEGELAGVMIGRAAYENPWILSDVDRNFYGKKNQNFSKKEIVVKYADFIDEKIQKLDVKEDFIYHYSRVVKPLTFLFQGDRGSGDFKRNLNNMDKKNPEFSLYQHVLDTLHQLEKVNFKAVNKRPQEEEC